LLSVVVLGAAVWLVAPAYGEVALPTNGPYVRVVDDSAHHQVFVADGLGLAAVSDDGTKVTTVPGESGAMGMVLDGSVLYVPHCAADQIDEVDAATLTRTGTFAAAGIEYNYPECDIGRTPGRLWMATGSSFALTSFDEAAPHTAHTTAFTARAPRYASVGSDLVIGAGDADSVYDVSGSQPTLVTSLACGCEGRPAISPDGLTVALPDHTIRSITDFTTASGSWATAGTRANAFAFSPDGTHIVEGGYAPLNFYDLANPTVPAWQFGSPDEFLADDVAFNDGGTRIFAGAPGALFIVDQTGASVTPWLAHITLSSPTSIHLGDTAHVGGTLTLGGSSSVGVTLHITRADPFGPAVSLPDVTTDGTGGFGFDDSPPNRGQVSYKVSFAGDAADSPASQTATMTVHGTSTTLTGLTLPAFVTYGRTVTLRAQLSPAKAGETIEFVRYDLFGSQVTGQELGTALTNASGQAQLKITFTTPGQYGGSFAGNQTDEPSQLSRVQAQMQPAIAATVERSYRHSHGVYLFHFRAKCATKHKGCPLFLVDVGPETASGAKLEAFLEVRSGRHWKQLGTSLIAPTGDLNGETIYGVLFRYNRTALGKTYRGRFLIDGTSFDGPGMAGNLTGWIAFRITR
jgi:hypothetical protein